MENIEKSGFYKPTEVDNKMPNIIPTYQEAFSDWPWYEVSKCVDKKMRCGKEFCDIAVGQFCKQDNEQMLIKPAYEYDELETKFKEIAARRPTNWYLEECEAGVSFATLSWMTNSEDVFENKYENNPEMKPWLKDIFGDTDFIWMDEAFANFKIKSKGNLDNFKNMCDGFMDKFENNIVAFRTINPKVISAVKKNYGDDAIIFNKFDEVPDRRDFVIIVRGDE